jgi:hypothetical protein
VESKLGPLGTSATEWPIVPTPVDCDDGEFGGMKIGRGNRSTRRLPAPAPLCPPQIPLDQTRSRTRTAAVGSQRLTAWAMARPSLLLTNRPIIWRYIVIETSLNKWKSETWFLIQSHKDITITYIVIKMQPTKFRLSCFKFGFYLFDVLIVESEEDKCAKLKRINKLVIETI